jgi:hypothetical protein
MLRVFLLAAILISADVVSADAVAAGDIFCTPTTHYLYVGSNTTKCDASTIDLAMAMVNCPNTDIVVTQAQSNVHASIANQSITIVGSDLACKQPPLICGRDAGCSSTAIPPKTAIVGDGAHPVFTIAATTASITFANLAISNGVGASVYAGAGGIMASGGTLSLKNVELHHNNGDSGGLGYVGGSGAVSLDGVSIHDNHAVNYGGGVFVSGMSGALSTLTIVDDPQIPTRIYSNTSDHYGAGIFGIFINLVAVSKTHGDISIYSNIAQWYGGGIGLQSSGTADIALPGNDLHDNQANVAGGGLYVYRGGTHRIFSTSETDPTQIDSNTAPEGGGIFVRSEPPQPHVCIFDTAFLHNSASGAAIDHQGGELEINAPISPDCDAPTLTALDARHCDSTNPLCNVYSDSTGDNVLHVEAGTTTTVRKIRVVGNSTTHGIRIENNFSSVPDTPVSFSQCIVAQNTFATTPFSADVYLLHTNAAFDSCTFANNATGETAFREDSGISISRSIIKETDPAFDVAAVGVSASNLLIEGPSSISGPTILYADANFVDAPNGNFHLQPMSAAIDFAPSDSTDNDGDFDSQPRTVDLPDVANIRGPRDLGAYEYQVGGVLDRIFLATFE